MPTGFRIFKTKRSGTWFDGEGARRFGGRWNSPGTKVLYTAATLSLATLEILVHLDSDELISAYSYAAVSFDDKLVENIENIATLPKDWNVSPIAPEVQQVGDQWVRSKSSVVLSVPTAMVPGERNYLINIEHPEVKKLIFSEPRRLVLDQRWIKKGN
ncbi:MAG: RES family NAD+ phosphorylase [Pyrinomonadaceae bacterium]